jgi:hypothetical protein
MIKVTLDEHVRECDHCGATNIKRTFCVKIPHEEKMYIGRICIGKLTNIDTSGNPYRAVERIQTYLNSLDEDEVIILLGGQE